MTGIDAGSDYWVPVGGNNVVVEFEPDNGGAVSVARISLQTCMDQDSQLGCDNLLIDTNYDGVPDSNILTGTGGARGTGPVRITSFLRFWSSTDPSGEVGFPVVRICWIAS